MRPFRSLLIGTAFLSLLYVGYSNSSTSTADLTDVEPSFSILTPHLRPPRNTQWAVQIQTEGKPYETC